MRPAAPPRFLTRPDGEVSNAAVDCIALADSVGVKLDAGQQLVLEAALGERADGKWAASTVGLVEPRQNGKGEILLARQLGGLYLFGSRLQTHTAHRFDTCLEHFGRIREVIERERWLLRRVKKISDTNGKESITLMTGQRLQFKARAKGSGRGFSGDDVYLDEMMWLQEMGSLVPTMAARGNPQLWYSGSAPLERRESDIQRGVMQRGRAGDPEMAYAEWSNDVDLSVTPLEEVDLDDVELWYQANPALGVRISLRSLRTERREMTDEEFARERLGLYRELDKGAAVIPSDEWAAAVRSDLSLSGELTYAVDTKPDRTMSCIAVAGAGDEYPAVEVTDHKRWTGWIVKRLVELKARNGMRAVVVDPKSPVGSLIGEMKDAGLPVVEIDLDGYAQACAEFYDAVVEEELERALDSDLDAAVRGASWRMVGERRLWNRKGEADITPLVAVTLARHGHCHPKKKKQRGGVLVV